MSVITLPPAFPLVGLGVVATVFLQTWQQGRVGAMRKETGVKYPTLYVTEAEAQADPKKMRYNCLQRAHANTLENVPFVLALTAFLGIYHPKVTTAFTLTWVFSRIFYTINYSSGSPETRHLGFAKLGYVGILGLLLGSIAVATQKTYQLYF